MSWLQDNLTGAAVALAGAVIASIINIPLPWLLGPLFATALWKIMGFTLSCDNRFRQAGQWVIGVSLGLHFTPDVLQLIQSLYESIIIGVGLAISLGVISALLIYKLLKLDLATAWFSSMVGGASEMATMAESYHAKVDYVASAHTVRVILVVTCIPFAFYYLGLHGSADAANIHHIPFSWSGFAILAIATSALAVFFRRIRLPVAWILAPLIVTGVLTANDIHLTGLTIEIKHIGQLMIGWSLGNKFTPGFFRRSPKFLLTVALFNIGSLLMTVLMAYLLHLYNGIEVPTLVLSLSAGGIAEMTITAEALHLGVAIVTVFHVIRMSTVVILTQPLFLLIRRFIPQ